MKLINKVYFFIKVNLEINIFILISKYLSIHYFVENLVKILNLNLCML